MMLYVLNLSMAITFYLIVQLVMQLRCVQVQTAKVTEASRQRQDKVIHVRHGCLIPQIQNQRHSKMTSIMQQKDLTQTIVEIQILQIQLLFSATKLVVQARNGVIPLEAKTKLMLLRSRCTDGVMQAL